MLLRQDSNYLLLLYPYPHYVYTENGCDEAVVLSHCEVRPYSAIVRCFCDWKRLRDQTLGSERCLGISKDTFFNDDDAAVLVVETQ